MRSLLLVASVLPFWGVALSAEDSTKNDIQELKDNLESLTNLVQNALINPQTKANSEDRNTLDASSQQNDRSLRDRVLALELKLAKADSQLQNDTNLEERVEALEFQMENEDITLIEGEISVINSEQNLHHTQIQQIENDINEVQGGLEVITGTVTELTAVTDDLQASVVSLQETDAGLTEDIAQLTEAEGTLDSRLSQLEVDGVVAFHAALGTYCIPTAYLTVSVWPFS